MNVQPQHAERAGSSMFKCRAWHSRCLNGPGLVKRNMLPSCWPIWASDHVSTTQLWIYLWSKWLQLCHFSLRLVFTSKEDVTWCVKSRTKNPGLRWKNRPQTAKQWPKPKTAVLFYISSVSYFKFTVYKYLSKHVRKLLKHKVSI